MFKKMCPIGRIDVLRCNTLSANDVPVDLRAFCKQEVKRLRACTKKRSR